MIKIVDYGLGNVNAFLNMYHRMNIPASVAQTASALDGADHFILPGVGAFDQAVEMLRGSGMCEILERKVMQEHLPILGVCVGMQILADESEEGNGRGLGWISGRVRAFRSVQDCAGLALPHMGWNDVIPLNNQALFKGLEQDARFYFLHSFFFECSRESNISATCEYGQSFACAINHENVYGVQFHPEKSHNCGWQLLKNFAEI